MDNTLRIAIHEKPKTCTFLTLLHSLYFILHVGIFFYTIHYVLHPTDESAEEAAIHVEKPSKVRVRETKPIQMSKVLLERHKTQVR
mgnify:FL=1